VLVLIIGMLRGKATIGQIGLRRMRTTMVW
jgi:hypothetical protein